jgi:hypothetical protein
MNEIGQLLFNFKCFQYGWVVDTVKRVKEIGGVFVRFGAIRGVLRCIVLTVYLCIAVTPTRPTTTDSGVPL